MKLNSPPASPQTKPRSMPFFVAYRPADIRRGAVEALPLGASAAPWGFVFGLLAQPLMDALQTLAMSAYVFSGTAQFVALERWQVDVSIASLLIAVFAVNARYILMGATLAPAFSHAGSGLAARMLTLFMLNDMSWALSMRRMGQGGIGVGFLLGASTVTYLAWIVSSMIGFFVPVPVEAAARWGLDFAVAAALVGLAGGSYTGRRSWLPWAVAAGVAAIVHKTLPGSLYIVAGGVAGALAAAFSGNDSAAGMGVGPQRRPDSKGTA